MTRGAERGFAERGQPEAGPLRGAGQRAGREFGRDLRVGDDGGQRLGDLLAQA